MHSSGGDLQTSDGMRMMMDRSESTAHLYDDLSRRGAQHDA
jgi:hypothetical protein